MNKQFMFADVKTVEGKDPNGEFEAILSAPTLDRDGEVIITGAFDPLPESIPVHAFHDFYDPIGRGVPYYDGDVLKLKGRFASTPRAQEMRTLVAEGVIGSMSVGFMAPAREDRDGVPHITKAEILEGSFVSIPSNREAAILACKAMNVKTSPDELREIVHKFFELLAATGAAAPNSPATDPEAKAAAETAASAPVSAAVTPLADVSVVRALAIVAEAELLLLD